MRLWCMIVGHLWWTIKEYEDAEGGHEIVRCARCKTKSWLRHPSEIGRIMFWTGLFITLWKGIG